MISRQVLLTMVVLTLIGTLTQAARASDGSSSQPAASEKVRGYIWHDRDCDGLRTAADEPLDGNPRGFQQFSLFYIGDDGVPFTPDDSEIDVSIIRNGGDSYGFFVGGGNHTYYIAIRPADRPIGYAPAPYQAGADQTVDNDLNYWPDGTWATGMFIIPGGFDAPTVTGIDLGLCQISYPYAINLPLIRR
jgi:hypothetical protein